jgi:fumarate reductase subunit D
MQRQRLGLQLVMTAACLIPIGAGLAGVVMGIGMLDKNAIGVSEDSQFRYLSGLLLAIGLCFLSLVPRIERAGTAMQLLTFIVFIGGLARLAGVLTLGLPSRPMLGGLTMELAVTPLLCLWQMSLARRYRAERPGTI